jgi:hypothetical protein
MRERTGGEVQREVRVKSREVHNTQQGLKQAGRDASTEAWQRTAGLHPSLVCSSTRHNRCPSNHFRPCTTACGDVYRPTCVGGRVSEPTQRPLQQRWRQAAVEPHHAALLVEMLQSLGGGSAVPAKVMEQQRSTARHSNRGYQVVVEAAQPHRRRRRGSATLWHPMPARLANARAPGLCHM